MILRKNLARVFHGPKGKGGLEVQNKPEKRKGFTEFFLLVRREAEQMGVDVNELFREKWDKLVKEAKPYNEVFPEEKQETEQLSDERKR